MITYVIAATVFVALLYFGIRYFVRTGKRFGGGRVIICPETGKQAMVEVDARHAALTSLLHQPDIRLESCWRWPLNKECGQECLVELDVAPPECLVRSVLMKWYKGRRCVFCQRIFEEISLTDHKPALLCLEGIPVEWSQVKVSNLREVLLTHTPVCWNCHIAQTFRREHPDLVVERSFTRQPSISRPGAVR
jgi:hypothetical protein